MTDFGKLDRADGWVARVTSAVRHRVMSAGQRQWNAPANAQARERAARLSQRAYARRDGEAASLERSGVPAGVIRARLRGNSEARTARTLDRHRNPSPLGRASR